jgi:hypothetical protein
MKPPKKVSSKAVPPTFLLIILQWSTVYLMYKEEKMYEKERRKDVSISVDQSHYLKRKESKHN